MFHELNYHKTQNPQKKNILIAVARMSRFQVKSGRFGGASINSQSPQSAKHAGIST